MRWDSKNGGVPNLQNLTGSFWSERQHRSFMSLPHREDNKYHPCHEAKCLSYISRSWAVSDVSRAKVQGVGPQGSPRHGARQGPPETGVSYGFEATAIHRECLSEIDSIDKSHQESKSVDRLVPKIVIIPIRNGANLYIMSKLAVS